MACHEIAALRLGLMRVLGRHDDGERLHELAELQGAAGKPGPIASLCEAQDLGRLKRFFESALADLDSKVATTPAGDPQLPYLRTLVVLTKKTEMDLSAHIDGLTRFYRELDEMHDLVHEMYPAD